MSRKSENLTGVRFGRLTALEICGIDKTGSTKWKCICDCGNTKIVCASSLKKGNTKSCGCLAKEVSRELAKNLPRYKHGKRYTKLWYVWQGMKQRCFNSNNKNYKYYGERGITICDEWKNDFNAFYEWAITNGYTDNLTIDRINNDGNYEPSNCRWVTNAEQQKNKRLRKTSIY